jgi:hypothetical protein
VRGNATGAEIMAVHGGTPEMERVATHGRYTRDGKGGERKKVDGA